MKEKLYEYLPIQIKNILVTIYNLRNLKVHNKRYTNLKKEYNKIFFSYSIEEIKEIQNKRFLEFIKFSKKNNIYYKDLLKNINISSIDDISKIPILNKDNLQNSSIKSNIDDALILGSTGGTTGKSLQFALTFNDFSERQANLDFFREMYGYQYKDETAWFSGKKLITEKETNKNIFWVRDYLHRTTYYSTRHIQDQFIDSMIDHINKIKPLFFVGFPSAIYSIAAYWQKSGKKIEIQLKAIFPTAEPLLLHQKKFLQEFFECPVPDQYASSEGAPFIYECPLGKLHFDMYSGIIEARYPDSDDHEILVTSFTTHYMPLLRYAIGDSVEFDIPETKCTCGSNMPIVKSIIGRTASFIYSEEKGIVGSGSLSDLSKYAHGIDKLQIIQKEINTITLLIVCEDSQTVKQKIEYEIRERIGNSIRVEYKFVDDIPPEKNGKFLMVKNYLDMNEIKIALKK